jgi:hypothetical protein
MKPIEKQTSCVEVHSLEFTLHVRAPPSEISPQAPSDPPNLLHGTYEVRHFDSALTGDHYFKH